jgi:Protein phosphatase 2C
VLLDADEPYRPDTIADGGHAFGLIVRAASVRGLTKRYLGGPRQDDLCLRVHQPTETVIAAVADGVSGAARSGLAAALVVRYATAAVVRQLDAGAEEIEWKQVFEQAAWALVEEHRRHAGDPGAGPEDAARMLATTLLVATVTAPGDESDDARVQLAAVGDSPAFILANRAFTMITDDSERTDGLIGGGVDALPRATRETRSHASRLARSSVLLLCTDGLSLPLAAGNGEVGRTFARELRRPPDVVDFARLLDFSRATYDDDRTLVAIWPER